jgi:ATP-binding protein involved in chromosome partitioning
MITKEIVTKVFDGILEPKLKWNINTLGLLKNVVIEENKVTVEVDLITEDETQIANFKSQVENTFKQFYNGELELIIGRAGISAKGIEGIKKIIFVASGKGGVGKSTVAVNLAAALSKLGNKVGLMDADIYGPSVPIMLGNFSHPKVLQEENLEPIEAHGIKFISIGSLVDKDKAVAWRGNLVSGTIIQFIQKTNWGELDFLVLDMPPGTGDIHLTIASQIRPNGIVMVTTPQEVVWGDVKRSLDLIKDEKFPVIGFVENMSYTVCQKCGETNHPFHSIKDESLPEGMEILAKIPLVRELSESADAGTPIVHFAPDSEVAKVYLDLATKVSQVD